jgi:hypothetical protein
MTAERPTDALDIDTTELPALGDETMLFAFQEAQAQVQSPEFEGELARLLRNAAAAEQQHADDPDVPPVPANRHRRQRRQLRWRSEREHDRERVPGRVVMLRVVNLVLAASAAAIVAMLSVLGGVISYEPLRGVAAPGVSQALASWWPLLIYGPWLVASLSILRAALHQRRVLHSWVVLILFSGLAVGLCIADAPKSAPSVAVAGLPPVSALVAFHQLVRQIALVNPPRHALPRPWLRG